MKIELETKINDDDENRPSLNLSDAATTLDKHKVLFSEECSSLYSDQRKEASFEYDYEINSIRFGEEKEHEFMYILTESKLLGTKFIKVDPYENLYDTINIPYTGDETTINANVKNKFKANIFKRLVSKKKRRIQNKYYDLDMAYITERVIGMGFPSTGCETFYRNSLEDLKEFLDRYHGEYKIYNLCIEKKRIYPKNIWHGKKVGLFPFNDHAPCPIKLILDFCVDLCIYLTVNPRGVAAIHCKAGKGRTGVMIVCYLIFSGLCENTEQALEHYAKQRTKNNRGVTIASQIRYIKYFETFLSANLERPFMKFIPRLVKYELNKGYKNMIVNYNVDMSYFTTRNSFKLKHVLIGPFDQEMQLSYNFGAITRKISFPNSKLTRKVINSKFYYEIQFNSDEKINYDIKLNITSKTLKFYSWFNLWYQTYEIISRYVMKHNYFEENASYGKDFTSALSHVKTTVGDKIPAGKETAGGILSKALGKNLKGIGKKVLNNAFSKVLSKYRKNKRKQSAIISMKNNKNLNDILDNMDQLAKDHNVEMLDRKNLEFVIDRKLLDKLKTKIKDPFCVKYTYQLNE